MVKVSISIPGFTVEASDDKSDTNALGCALGEAVLALYRHIGAIDAVLARATVLALGTLEVDDPWREKGLAVEFRTAGSALLKQWKADCDKAEAMLKEAGFVDEPVR